MSVCVPCRRAGVDREATAFDGEVPICDDHANGTFVRPPLTCAAVTRVQEARIREEFTPAVARAAIARIKKALTAPAIDPARNEQTMSEPEAVESVIPPGKRRGRRPKVKFIPPPKRRGRPPKLTGLDDGPPLKRRGGRPPKFTLDTTGSLDHIPSNITNGSVVDDMIARLHARRVKIDAAIAALRALHGMDVS